jgi:rhodanese-related sulfurtransferase
LRSLCSAPIVAEIQQETAMPQTITRHVLDMVAEANSEVKVLTQEEARALHGREDVEFIDLRDIRELAKTGRIAGAHHVPRCMLEFWIDPKSPYHKPLFNQDKTYVFYCAGGWRSALSAKTAQDMGLKPVAHIDGGFGEWQKRGYPVEPPRKE